MTTRYVRLLAGHDYSLFTTVYGIGKVLIAIHTKADAYKVLERMQTYGNRSSGFSVTQIPRVSHDRFWDREENRLFTASAMFDQEGAINNPKWYEYLPGESPADIG